MRPSRRLLLPRQTVPQEWIDFFNEDKRNSPFDGENFRSSKKTLTSQLAQKISTPAQSRNSGTTDLKNDVQAQLAIPILSVLNLHSTPLTSFSSSIRPLEQKRPSWFPLPSPRSRIIDEYKLLDCWNSNEHHSRNLPILGTKHVPSWITTFWGDDLLDQKRRNRDSKYAPGKCNAWEWGLLLLLRSDVYQSPR